MQHDSSTVLTVSAPVRPRRKPLKRLGEPLVSLLPSLKRGVNEKRLFGRRLEQNYGDVPGDALTELTADIWDQDDRHAPPTHPAR
jgi:hypothetical protein